MLPLLGRLKAKIKKYRHIVIIISFFLKSFDERRFLCSRTHKKTFVVS